jgi:transcriptional regulator with XRE-family HTH domain
MKRTPPLPVRIGHAIRRRREQQCSQEDFAEKIGMHRTYYSQIERGKKDIRLGTLERICDALGVKISDIMKDIEREASK